MVKYLRIELLGKEAEARKREWTRGRLEGRSGKGRELRSPPERMTDASSTRVHRQLHQPTRIVAQQHSSAIRVVRWKPEPAPLELARGRAVFEEVDSRARIR